MSTLTLVVGSNSYCSVEEADGYNETKIGNESWAALGSDTKIKALIGACNILETFNWFGRVAEVDQNLQWPRDVHNPGVYSETPKNIVFAQSELAFQLTRGFLANSAVSMLKVGSLQINTKNTDSIPLEVMNLIKSYINYQPRLVRT